MQPTNTYFAVGTGLLEHPTENRQQSMHTDVISATMQKENIFEYE